MFDLNRAIDTWHRGLESDELRRGETLDELESHVREEVERFVKSGLHQEQAFERAVSRIGQSKDLAREFAKVGREKPSLREYLNGDVLALKVRRWTPRLVIGTGFLFIGFSGLTGWLGTTAWMLARLTDRDHAPFWQALASRSTESSFFLIPTLIGLTVGLILLWENKDRARLLIRSLAASFILMPAYITIGTIAIFLTLTLANGTPKQLDVVQSVVSPNGAYEAYVRNGVALDGPNHRLYIRRVKDRHFMLIEPLRKGIDACRGIWWSPDSEMVVFLSHFYIIAVQVPGYNTVRIPLPETVDSIQTGKAGALQDFPPVSVEFPRPGVFQYRLGETGGGATVDLACVLGDTRSRAS